MKVATQCPKCSKRFSVDSSLLGKKGRCPECKSVFIIQEAYDPPSIFSEIENNSNNDDNLLSPVASIPSASQTGVIGGLTDEARQQRRERVRKTEMSRSSSAPSYWAVKVTAILFIIIGFLTMISAIVIMFQSSSQRKDLRNEIASKETHIEKQQEHLSDLEREKEKLLASPDTGFDLMEKIDEISSEIVGIQTNIEMTKIEIEVMRAQLKFLSEQILYIMIAAIISGIFIIAFGQMMECLRDIAINSYSTV